MPHRDCIIKAQQLAMHLDMTVVGTCTRRNRGVKPWGWRKKLLQYCTKRFHVPHPCDVVPAHRPKAGRHGLCGQLEQLDHARHRHARLLGPRHTVSATRVLYLP